MKYLLLLFLAGCAHSKFNVVGDAPLKLCHTPASVYNDQQFNHKADYIGLGAHYWNKATGLQLFSFHGDIQRLMKDPLNGVLIYWKEDDGKMSSRQLLVSTSRNCIVGARIYLRSTALENNRLQTILRKELGYVLGLKSSNDFTDLMFYNHEPTLQDPVDASEETINAIRSVYSN